MPTLIIIGSVKQDAKHFPRSKWEKTGNGYSSRPFTSDEINTHLCRLMKSHDNREEGMAFENVEEKQEYFKRVFPNYKEWRTAINSSK